MENELVEISSRIKARVLSRRQYRLVNHSLIEQIISIEIQKGRKEKDTEKAVLSKLHQVGKAFFLRKLDFQEWIKELHQLPTDIYSERTQSFCRRIMKSHHSTDERLPIVADFYREILAEIGEISSLMDLACGFNPLAFPWMPTAPHTYYYGCDIFQDLADFLNVFWDYFGLKGSFSSSNIFDLDFKEPVQVAFILKSLPCLEQVEKDFSLKLLRSIPAAYLLISYPVGSLSGKNKGMRETYTNQFRELMKETKWEYSTYTFSSEMAFLVKKPDG